MFDNEIGDHHRSVFNRVNARMAVCCAVMSGVMLSWNSCVNAEEFDTVHIGEAANVDVHADSQPVAVQNLDASVVEVNDKESRPVDTAPELPVDTAPDLSDVVQLDTSKGDQNSPLDLADSRDMQSLDVVDTASSDKFPLAVDDLGGGIDDQKSNVDLGAQPVVIANDMIDEGARLGADLNDMIEQGDQQLVAVDIVNLSVTNTADAPGRQASDAGSQLKDASNDAASEESAGLPYAVVLALLALIGLVPVARRNDQHHV